MSAAHIFRRPRRRAALPEGRILRALPAPPEVAHDSTVSLPQRPPVWQPRHARPADAGTWDRTPQTARRVADALRAPEHAARPPRIHPLPPELPRHEGPRAAQVVAMLKAVRYPGCFGTPEDYAATMKVWSRLTGTRSAGESLGAWPRPALGEVCEPADWTPDGAA